MNAPFHSTHIYKIFEGNGLHSSDHVRRRRRRHRSRRISPMGMTVTLLVIGKLSPDIVEGFFLQPRHNNKEAGERCRGIACAFLKPSQSENRIRPPPFFFVSYGDADSNSRVLETRRTASLHKIIREFFHIVTKHPVIVAIFGNKTSQPPPARDLEDLEVSIETKVDLHEEDHRHSLLPSPKLSLVSLDALDETIDHTNLQELTFGPGDTTHRIASDSLMMMYYLSRHLLP